MLRIDDVMPMSGPRPQGAARVTRAPGDWDVARRRFLTGALTVGAGVGLSALGVFPPARRAMAEGYDIKDLPCPSYALDHDCDPGCGPSISSEGYCIEKFHRTDADEYWDYSLRPNQCYGGYYDGWLWDSRGACDEPCTRGARFRCHDGYKVDRSNGDTTPTVCRVRYRCKN